MFAGFPNQSPLLTMVPLRELLQSFLISQGNKSCREMLAVFSSKSFTHALDSQPKTKVKLLPETRLTHLSCQTWKQKCKCSQQDSPCTDPPPHLPSGKIGKISMIFWLLASPAALPLSYRRLVEAKAILTLTKKSGLSLTHRCGKILATFSNKTYAYPLPRPNSKTSLQFLNMILKSLRPQ